LLNLVGPFCFHLLQKILIDTLCHFPDTLWHASGPLGFKNALKCHIALLWPFFGSTTCCEVLQLPLGGYRRLADQKKSFSDAKNYNWMSEG